MDKNNLKQAKNDSVVNKDKNDATNKDVTRMYNMQGMSSGPGDATQEEKMRLKEQTLVQDEK